MSLSAQALRFSSSLKRHVSSAFANFAFFA